ncbi:MAG: FecR domain-containing protein [Candidatus Gracilibacteria bacterium]|nr:FecR domain-containing protein [Candidatus Gracilibacteria bacterium]
MKIILNKFVILTVLIIFSLIAYQIYQINNSFAYKDTNSYFHIIKGNGYISTSGTKKILRETSSKEILKAGDIVSTIGGESLGVIEWGDNSITRIGGNSKLEIKETDIRGDLSSIKINFKLIEGKSWSNVVSMFDSNSHFNEEFQDVIAGVRGTVFEVNLDNDYVYVKDHQVEINNISKNEIKTLNAGDYYSLNLLEIIKNLDGKAKDALWQTMNENIDKDYIKSITSKAINQLNSYKGKFNINNYLDSKYTVTNELQKSNPNMDKIKKLISEMTDEDKNKLYYMLMFDYQKLNIIDSSSDIFIKKMNYRDALMLVATDENKKTILKYTFYDLNDSLNTYSGANLDSITGFLGANKNYISSIGVDTSVVDLSGKNLNLDGLKNIMGNNMQNLENILGVEKLKALKGDTVKDTLNNINDSAKEKVNDTLNSIFNSIKK